MSRFVICRLALLASLAAASFFAAEACAQGVITTVAGSPWVFRGDGGPATNAPLGRVSEVAVDAAGNVFAADSDSHLVVKISPTGVLTVVAGNGILGFSGDGGPATSASLSFPQGVAVDAAGNLYIAEVSGRIRKVASDGTITTIAGNGQPTFSGDGGPATSASLNFPSGVAVDGGGNFYIADQNNHRIRKFSLGGIITTVAGTGVAGFSGDGGPATGASLNSPRGVAVDAAGNLYIADAFNNRIRKVNPGGTITTVAGGSFSLGDGGPATSAFLNVPLGVAVDAAGNLYIADFGHNRIRKVSSGGTISTVVGTGVQGFSGDGGSATDASLNHPHGVAVDVAANIYIADSENQRIRKVSASGTINTLAGNGQFKFSGDGGPATSASLNQPVAVAVDAAGSLYIASSKSNRVRKVDPSGTITTIAGNGSLGFSGDGGPATSASLNFPFAVAVDAAGNLYIADGFNNRIRKVNPGGTISTVAGGGSASGDGGPATGAALSIPQGVALDAVGNLYIAEAVKYRIRKVSSGGTITTVAGNATRGFSGDGGPATSASLNNPIGVALDAAGNLYIADSFNNRIRKVSPGGTITTVAGNGTQGFAGDGGPATSAALSFPQGVAVDAAGNLYIADTSSQRIRKVDVSGTITTVAGGSCCSLGDGGPAASALLNNPEGVAVDAAGNLYIADTINDRVRKVLAAAPLFSVAPTSLSFSAPAGAPVVAAQQIGVLSSVTGLGWTAQASTASAGNWLSVSPASGSVPGIISVSVNVATLAPGNYQGTVTVQAPLANPPTQTVTVGLTVQGSVTDKLLAEPIALTFEGRAGGANPPVQLVRISSAGPGTLTWTARAVTSDGGNWLNVSIGSGSASAASPATIQVSASLTGLSPGVYSGSVIVESQTTNETRAVPVTLLLSQAPQTILLSQTGLLFAGVQGGAMVPSQSLAIRNTGQGVMNWTLLLNTLSGGNWLSASPLSGSSDAGSLQVPLVDVGADVSSLSAGQFSGLIRVNAPTANNSPQFATVEFNVLPAGSNPGVVIRPTGLIFTVQAGTSSPSSQLIRLATAKPGSVEIRTALRTEGGDWLQILPPNLVLSPADPRTIVVQPSLNDLTTKKDLAPGVYRGSVTLQFDDGSASQIVDILFLVVGQSAGPSGAAAFDSGGTAAAACAPQKLLAVHRSLGNKFAALLGLPTAMEVQVSDDCGSAVPNATVLASFSNNDPPLRLASQGNGTYTGTWRPVNPAAQVTVKVRADLPPLVPAELQALLGQVQDNPKALFLASGGIVNAANFAAGEALAPGMMVAAFGRNLAASTIGASSLPLPKTLGGATLSIGNLDVPLFFASNGQINAQLPFELAPNSRQQVVVKAPLGDTGRLAITVPETVTVAAARPAIFATNQQGTGQGEILIAGTASLAAPSGSVAGRDARAVKRGQEFVSIYCTGLGDVSNRPASGAAASNNPLSETLLKPTVTIGGVPAPVNFSGLAPFFAGLYQLNAQVAAEAPTGDAVQVVLTIGGVSSTPVTIAVQ